jgi:ricin-type beta-trefoil lectin protein
MHLKRAASTLCAAGSAAVLAIFVAGSANATTIGYSHAWNNSNSVDQCLALASSTLGNATVMWTCDSESGQNWLPYDTTEGTDTLENGVDEGSACLDGMNYGGGSHVYVEPCDGSSSQQWAPIWDGSLAEWRNASTKLCLAVAGGSTSNGAEVITWACNATPDELWGGSLGD